MENAEAKQELINDATGLAYSHIRFSGLYKQLSNDEWEQLADKLGVEVYELLERRIDDFLTEKEAAKAA